MISDVQLLSEAARDAGALALSLREQGLKIWSKGDAGPVTDADIAVNDLLMERLRTNPAPVPAFAGARRE